MPQPFTNAFTTRMPIAVLIVFGIKQWENRSAMPSPPCGRCAMSCSKGSDARDYAKFFAWTESVFPTELFHLLPHWERVASWRGKIVATCDYRATLTPGPSIWNERYAVWWRLSNVRLLHEPIPCRGNVGMWQLPSGGGRENRTIWKIRASAAEFVK